MIVLRNKFYLVSTIPDLDRRIQKPGIPDNFLTRGKYITPEIPRIPLYTSPEDAVSGYLLGRKFTGTLYLYQPLDIYNDYLLEAPISSVPYVFQVPEWWYLRGIRLKKIKALEILGEEKELPYRYGPRQTKGILYKHQIKS